MAKKTRKKPSGDASKSRQQPAPARNSLLADKRMLRVALTFVVLFTLMQAATWWLAYNAAFDGILDGMARFSGACDRALGLDARVRGNEIAVGGRVLRIDLECTAISLMAIYSALVLAYPLGWRRKVTGLMGGLLAIQAFNQVRLIAVAWLSGRTEDAVFRFAHDYLFMTSMVIVVVAAWGVYLARAGASAHASNT